MISFLFHSHIVELILVAEIILIILALMFCAGVQGLFRFREKKRKIRQELIKEVLLNMLKFKEPLAFNHKLFDLSSINAVIKELDDKFSSMRWDEIKSMILNELFKSEVPKYAKSSNWLKRAHAIEAIEQSPIASLEPIILNLLQDDVPEILWMFSSNFCQ